MQEVKQVTAKELFQLIAQEKQESQLEGQKRPAHEQQHFTYDVLVRDWMVHEITLANLEQLESDGENFCVCLDTSNHQKPRLVGFAHCCDRSRVCGLEFYPTIYTPNFQPQTITNNRNLTHVQQSIFLYFP
eukprot:m.219030 g.219030  ORF g.219030 m.219030 type:complete len:131 (-) comp26276_c0_seq3:154-546(-)